MTTKRKARTAKAKDELVTFSALGAGAFAEVWDNEADEAWHDA